MARNFLSALIGQQVVQPNLEANTAFTPSYTNISAVYAQNQGNYSRFLNRMRGTVQVVITSVSAIGGIYTMTIPGGFSIDAALQSTSNEGMVGKIMIWDASASYLEYFGTVNVASATTLKFKMAGQTSFNNNTAPITLAAGDIIFFDFDIPISGWLTTSWQAYNAGLANLVTPGLVYESDEINIAAQVTSGQAGFAVTQAVAVVYKDKNNNWRMKFNIVGTFTSASVTSLTVVIAGVSFKTGIFQAVEGYVGGSGAAGKQSSGTSPNTGNVVVNYATALTGSTSVGFYGDVALNSKPSWA
jgi:hypothetical protein